MHVDITSIATGEPPNIPGGPELASFTDALGGPLTRDPSLERAALIEVLGEARTERVVGVAATFQMMNRLLDGVGAPVSSELRSIAGELGFDPVIIPR